MSLLDTLARALAPTAHVMTNAQPRAFPSIECDVRAMDAPSYGQAKAAPACSALVARSRSWRAPSPPRPDLASSALASTAPHASQWNWPSLKSMSSAACSVL